MDLSRITRALLLVSLLAFTVPALAQTEETVPETLPSPIEEHAPETSQPETSAPEPQIEVEPAVESSHIQFPSRLLGKQSDVLENLSPEAPPEAIIGPITEDRTAALQAFLEQWQKQLNAKVDRRIAWLRADLKRAQNQIANPNPKILTDAYFEASEAKLKTQMGTMLPQDITFYRNEAKAALPQYLKLMLKVERQAHEAALLERTAEMAQLSAVKKQAAYCVALPDTVQQSCCFKELQYHQVEGTCKSVYWVHFKPALP